MSEPAPARARMLLDLGRHAEALRVLQAHLAVTPQDARALCLMAQAELGLDHHYRALLAAREALTIDPQSEWAWRLQALALVGLNDHEEAQRSADSAVRLAPQTYQTHSVRAQVYLAAGATGAAAASASTALGLAPNVANNWSVAGTVDLGRRRHRSARARFVKALSLDPTDATARNNLAVIDLRRRRFGRAISGFLATARADPHSDLAVRNLRVVLHYALLLLTLLVLVASFVSRSQADARGPDGSDARLVIALTAVIPIIVAVAGILCLRRALAGAFTTLVRDVLHATWRVGAGIGLLSGAMAATAVAAMLPPRAVQPMLWVATLAAFGAIWTLPRRLPSAGYFEDDR